MSKENKEDWKSSIRKKIIEDMKKQKFCKNCRHYRKNRLSDARCFREVSISISSIDGSLVFSNHDSCVTSRRFNNKDHPAYCGREAGLYIENRLFIRFLYWIRVWYKRSKNG